MRKTQQKGITLIALVITIIVLLILAGVAISMLAGENGILKQAAEAKEKTEKKTTEEQIKLAAMDALMRGNDPTSIESEGILSEALESQGLKNPQVDTIDEGYKVTANGVTQIISNSGNVRNESGVEKNIGVEITGTKATLLDVNNEQIVVPVGFTIKEDSPTTVKDGIVVVAPDNSEFVWVPVKNAVYDSANKDIGKLPKTSATGTLTGNTYTPMSIEVNGEYKGILYNYSSTGGAYLYYPDATNYQGTTSQFREPDYLDSTSDGDADTDANKGIHLLSSIVKIAGDTSTAEGQKKILDTWSEQLQDEYNKMVISVRDNKGFYVGRYETSLNESGYAQSIAGEPSAKADPASANTWYGLYQKEKEYSTNEYEEGKTLESVVGSSMIWGSQYDQMLIWMRENGLDIASKDSTKLKGAVKNDNLSYITGIEGDKDILNNVYDIIGCRWEWTLEASSTVSRSARSSDRHSSVYPCSRSKQMPYASDTLSKGSRLTLYVK